MRRGLLACALAAALLLPAELASAKKVPRHFYGVSALQRPTLGEFERMGEDRVGLFRFTLHWRVVQPRRGEPFDWSRIDQTVAKAALAGVDLLPVLYGAPAWAVDCGDLEKEECSRIAPVYSEQGRVGWLRFVQAAVHRYGPEGSFWRGGTSGGGSTAPGDPPVVGDVLPELPLPGESTATAAEAIPYAPITRWQVWNEPSSPTYWQGHEPSAKRYARLVKIAHAGITSVDRNAYVMLAGLFGTPFGGRDPKLFAWRYLKRFYNVDEIKRHFDAAAVHPYSPGLYGIRFQMRRARKVIRKAHDRRTELWVTEFGWGSGKRKHGELLKGKKGQARMLRRAYKLLRTRQGRWNVGGGVWFTWRDPDPSSTLCTADFCKSSGLLRNDRQPKRSYQTLKKVIRRTARS